MIQKALFCFSLIAATTVGAVSYASTTTPIRSQEEYTVGAGDLETQFAIKPEFVRGDGHLNSFEFTAGANYFMSDILAPGLEFDIARVQGATTATFLPNIKGYLQGLKRVLPYAQVGLGYAHLPTRDLFDLRIGPGVDFMLSNTVAIGIQLRYDLGIGDGTFHDIAFPIGFQIYFRL